jgi:hypothetical protein
MSGAFIPPAPERPDHRSAVVGEALSLIEGRMVSIKEHHDRKKAEGADRDGFHYSSGMVDGLLVARELLKGMIRGCGHA